MCVKLTRKRIYRTPKTKNQGGWWKEYNKLIISSIFSWKLHLYVIYRVLFNVLVICCVLYARARHSNSLKVERHNQPHSSIHTQICRVFVYAVPSYVYHSVGFECIWIDESKNTWPILLLSLLLLLSWNWQQHWYAYNQWQIYIIHCTCSVFNHCTDSVYCLLPSHS